MCSPTSARSSTIPDKHHHSIGEINASIDDVVNETRAKIDKDAIEKEGLFPAVYLSTMRAQKKDKVDGLSYLEQQFSALDLPVPKLQRRFDEACKEAESLVFDLLSENSND